MQVFAAAQIKKDGLNASCKFAAAHYVAAAVAAAAVQGFAIRKASRMKFADDAAMAEQLLGNSSAFTNGGAAVAAYSSTCMSVGTAHHHGTLSGTCTKTA